MGKGDTRTRRGKVNNGSYGKRRPHDPAHDPAHKPAPLRPQARKR